MMGKGTGQLTMGNKTTIEALRFLLKDANIVATEVWPGSVDSFGGQKGAYLLVIELDDLVTVRLPGRSGIPLAPGTYLYAGSANGPGGIGARLARHFKPVKKIHWHVDQLTCRAAQMAALAVTGGSECVLGETLVSSGKFQPAIAGFGNSDCRRCASHLFVSV